MTLDGDRPSPSHRWVPFALIALVALPALFGALRVVELAGGPRIMPVSPGMTASPAPVVIHIICGLVYAVVGAFQFSTALRHRRTARHRRAGRVVVGAGFGVASSALWMTIGYPRQAGTGELAFVFRILFATGLATSLILGVTAIRTGDVPRHRAWMTRAYALALGAGTQVFTQPIATGLFGTSTLTTDLALGSGWVIHLIVAELLIRRGILRTSRRPMAERRVRQATARAAQQGGPS